MAERARARFDRVQLGACGVTIEGTIRLGERVEISLGQKPRLGQGRVEGDGGMSLGEDHMVAFAAVALIDDGKVERDEDVRDGELPADMPHACVAHDVEVA